MPLFCYFGRHKPSLASTARGKRGGYVALCEACGCPLERQDNGKWHAAEPLAGRTSKLERS